MWETVIDYLQTELRRTTRQQRVQQIQSAIATFKANIERGVPWPGQSVSQNSEQQHSSV